MNSFNKAANHYAAEAQVQKFAAEYLFQLIQKHWSGDLPGQVLELGAGTGFLTHQLMEWMQFGRLEINDISLAMLMQNQLKAPKKSSLQTHFSCGDMSSTQWPHCSELVCSSNSIQWVPDFFKILNSKKESFPQGTLFAFSTFGPNNLFEFYKSYELTTGEVFPRQVWSQSSDQWNQKLKELNFDLLCNESKTFKQRFPNLKSILKHFKLTGVNTPLNLLTPAIYRKWSQNFPIENNSFPLSWDMQFFLFRK